jgi:chemotaxis protein MotB
MSVIAANEKVAAANSGEDIPVETTPVVIKNHNQSNIDELMDDTDSSSWVLTFLDLMTLLLVFFILLFSVASFKMKESANANSDLKNGQLANMQNPIGLSQSFWQDFRAGMKENGFVSQNDALLTDIQNILLDNELYENVAVEKIGRKTVIRVDGKILFNSGHAKLKQTATNILEIIYSILQKHSGYKINIQGHTDNIPINSVRFPSNWELSAIRATTVLRYMVNQGIDTERLTATGYADELPLVKNNSAEQRAINRRVEFVLEKNQ